MKPPAATTSGTSEDCGGFQGDFEGDEYALEEQLMEAFKVVDRNGDGFISAAELRRDFKHRGEVLIYNEVRDIIREVDRDRDEKVNFEVFADR